MNDYDFELDELDTDVSDATICDIHDIVTSRECKLCGMDTCSVCVSCEYCG